MDYGLISFMLLVLYLIFDFIHDYMFSRHIDEIDRDTIYVLSTLSSLLEGMVEDRKEVERLSRLCNEHFYDEDIHNFDDLAISTLEENIDRNQSRISILEEKFENFLEDHLPC